MRSSRALRPARAIMSPGAPLVGNPFGPGGLLSFLIAWILLVGGAIGALLP